MKSVKEEVLEEFSILEKHMIQKLKKRIKQRSILSLEKMKIFLKRYQKIIQIHTV